MKTGDLYGERYARTVWRERPCRPAILVITALPPSATSVTNFGTVGDGVADDHKGFTATLAHVAAANDDAVHTLAGRYLSNCTLVIGDATALHGVFTIAVSHRMRKDPEDPPAPKVAAHSCSRWSPRLR
jgi:hypothetical protein